MKKQDFESEKANNSFSYEMAFIYWNENRGNFPEISFEKFQIDFRNFLSHANQVIMSARGQPKLINAQHVKEILYNFFEKKFENEKIDE